MRSVANTVYARLLRNRIALAGLVIIGIFGVLAVTAPLIARYDPIAVNFEERLQGPSGAHWLGTDQIGRDVLARLLYGSRLSLGTAAVASLLIMAIALTVGAISGYAGGLLDAILMRTVDLLLAFPGLILALALVGVLGAGIASMLVAVVSVWWTGYARIVRGVALVICARQYVEAARALGAKDSHIVVRHLIPNILPVVIVISTLQLGNLILALAALSFLGLGVQPPQPEWGSMINNGRPFFDTAPYLMIAPGLAIAIAALGFNLLGDGLRDVLDPILSN